MSEEVKEKKEVTTPKSSMSTAVAIIIAGALIAGAVWLTSAGNSRAPEAELKQVPSAPEVAKEQPKAEVKDVPDVTSEDHIRGPVDAAVTFIEYSDLECPFCQRHHDTMGELAAAYPNDVRFVFRHFPLEQLHSKAKTEAVATECAGEQGKFWELVDVIFEVTPSNNGLDLETLPELAQQAGVADAAQFATCLEEGRYMEKIDASVVDAQAAGGRGTPFSIIVGPNGEKLAISGAQPLASISAVIDEMLGE